MIALLAVAALASALVVAATVSARRWGHAVGGVVSAFPLIVGPVLLVAAHRHGAEFAARAAAATLLGLVSVSAFALAYARSAVRRGWWASLLTAWAAALLGGLAAGQVEAGLALSGLIAGAAIVAARAALPAAAGASAPPVALAAELPVRVVTTAALIVVITLAADRFGPVVAGILSALPVLASVLAALTHRGHGPDALVDLLRGMLVGLTAFAAFCLIVGGLVGRVGILTAFASATAAAVGLQALAARRHSRPRSGTSRHGPFGDVRAETHPLVANDVAS
jgi:hypothetical protein